MHECNLRRSRKLPHGFKQSARAWPVLALTGFHISLNNIHVQIGNWSPQDLSACQPPPQPPAWRLRRLLFVSQVCDLPHASIIFWRLAVAIAAAAAPLRVLLVHCMLFFGRRQWTQPTEALSCVLHPMESLAAVRYEMTAACMSCRAVRAIPTTQSFTHTHRRRKQW